MDSPAHRTMAQANKQQVLKLSNKINVFRSSKISPRFSIEVERPTLNIVAAMRSEQISPNMVSSSQFWKESNLANGSRNMPSL
jgi:hypothetical protein